MAGSVAVKVSCLVLMCMLVASPMAVEGLSCGDVATQLAPCINYLRSAGPLPPACCNGVKNLKNSAATTQDRRTACKCLINASKSISGVNFGLAAGLPGKCGVNIPYKISPSTNCDQYLPSLSISFSPYLIRN